MPKINRVKKWRKMGNHPIPVLTRFEVDAELAKIRRSYNTPVKFKKRPSKPEQGFTPFPKRCE
jgi:hypothetical protein